MIHSVLAGFHHCSYLGGSYRCKQPTPIKLFFDKLDDSAHRRYVLILILCAFCRTLQWGLRNWQLWRTAVRVTNQNGSVWQETMMNQSQKMANSVLNRYFCSREVVFLVSMCIWKRIFNVRLAWWRSAFALFGIVFVLKKWKICDNCCEKPSFWIENSDLVGLLVQWLLVKTASMLVNVSPLTGNWKESGIFTLFCALSSNKVLPQWPLTAEISQFKKCIVESPM